MGATGPAAGMSARIYAGRAPPAPSGAGSSSGSVGGGGSYIGGGSSSSSLSSMGGGPGAPSALSLLKSPPPALSRSISYGGESSIDQVVRSGHHHGHPQSHHYPYHHHGQYHHRHLQHHAASNVAAAAGGSPRMRRAGSQLSSSVTGSPSSASGLASPILPSAAGAALAAPGMNSPGDRERGRAFFPDDDRPSPRTFFYGGGPHPGAGGGGSSSSTNGGGTGSGNSGGHVISPSAQSDLSGHTSSAASSLSASTAAAAAAALALGGIGIGSGGPSPRLPAHPDAAASPSPRNPFGYEGGSGSSSSSSNLAAAGGAPGDVASPPHPLQHPYMGGRSPMVHTRELAMAQLSGLSGGQGAGAVSASLFPSNSSTCSSGAGSGDEGPGGAGDGGGASVSAAPGAGGGGGGSGSGAVVSTLLARRSRSGGAVGATSRGGVGQLVPAGGAEEGRDAVPSSPGGLLGGFLKKKKRAAAGGGAGGGSSSSNSVAAALKGGMKDAARRHNDRVLAARLEEAKFGGGTTTTTTTTTNGGGGSGGTSSSSTGGQFPRNNTPGAAAGHAATEASGMGKAAGLTALPLPYEFGLWKGSSGGSGTGAGAMSPARVSAGAAAFTIGSGLLLSNSRRTSEARIRRRKTVGDELDLLSPSEGEDQGGSSTGGASSLESSQESVVDVSVLIAMGPPLPFIEEDGSSLGHGHGHGGDKAAGHQFQLCRALTAAERQRMQAAPSTSSSGSAGGSSVDRLERGARQQLSPPKAKRAAAAEEKGAEVGVGDEAEDQLMEAGASLQAVQQETIEWKKGAQIGKGTFGSVFVGLNARTGERFAVKEIGLVDGSRAEVVRLEKEIVLMKRLHHAHIVRYLGTAHGPHHLYIFMEYVPGGSIASMLAQYGAFGQALIRRLVAQVVLGIAYLHEKGIVHRDIKGANVLVTNDGVAKLADFGCSRQLQGLQSAGSLENSLKTITGSVPWMAPEVIKQSGRFPTAADIWSIGATVIEMATGRHPWPEFSNQLAALFHVATATSPPALPPGLSPVGQDFLRRCLVIDEGSRAKAPELLRHPFISGEVAAEAAAAAAEAEGREELAASVASLSLDQRR